MSELLQAAFSTVNILPTAMLAFVLVYWIAVIFGLLDLDFLDIEVETGNDVNAGGISAIAWLNSALAFFNLGKIPLMVFLTFVALPFWTISILVNYYLHNDSVVIGMLYLLPGLVVALFISKVLTMPFIKLFAALEIEHESAATVIGQICTVVLPANTTELGQASVKTKGSPLLLNVKTTMGSSLKKGETALVIDYNNENNFYLIEPYESN